MSDDGNEDYAGIVDVEIERLGAQGDGVALIGSGNDPRYIPFALPDERVRVRFEGERGELVDVLRPSPDRIEPKCRHFTECGGCAMQHLAPRAYALWKRSLVVEAMAQRGLTPAVGDLVAFGPGSRRRAVLAALRTKQGTVIGFHAARGTTVVDLDECPVLNDRITAAIPGLRRLLASIPAWKGEARLTVVAAENGLDVGIDGAITGSAPDAATSARLALEAEAIPGLLRLSIDMTPVFTRATPEIAAGRARVTPPPGVFLQAAALAERWIAEAIVAARPKRAKKAADLFAGVGAFTLPLAAHVAVTAVDSDRQALAALEAAARRSDGLKPIQTLNRDLFREPLSRKELDGFDVVILDPPRAGARAQSEMLAKSKVPLVVAISCNPATLARDLRILVDGGYTIDSVTPIDQFLWSPHVEAVAVLSRTAR